MDTMETLRKWRRGRRASMESLNLIAAELSGNARRAADGRELDIAAPPPAKRAAQRRVDVSFALRGRRQGGADTVPHSARVLAARFRATFSFGHGHWTVG